MCAKAKISFLLCGRSGRQMRWPLTSDSSAIPAVNRNSTRRYLKLQPEAPPMCCACDVQRATCDVQRALSAAGHCSLSAYTVPLSGMPTDRQALRHTRERVPQHVL